jgi:hypothetical protein
MTKGTIKRVHLNILGSGKYFTLCLFRVFRFEKKGTATLVELSQDEMC